MTGEYYRYWPDRNLTEMSLEEAKIRASRALQGLINSAYNRFNLALTLTAGWDSRVILAATRQIKDSVFYFTMMYWDLTEKSQDIEIPSRLLSKLDLNIISSNVQFTWKMNLKIYEKMLQRPGSIWQYCSGIV
jgi:hypothetical protein